MAALDELDVRILREFFSGERYFYANRLAPAAEMARRVGAHRNTVQVRLRRLADAKLFLPAVLDVAAARLGLCSCRVVLSPPSRFDEEAIMLVDGVKALNKHGSRWGALIYAEDERTLDARLALLQRMTGSTIEDWSFRQVGAAAQRAKLSERQYRILADVVGHERPDWPVLAARLLLSERTVRREIDALIEEHVLTVYPSGDAPTDGAHLGYVRMPKGDAGDAPENYVIRHETPEGQHYFVVAPSAEAFEAQALRMLQRSGGYSVPWTSRRTSPNYHPWLSGLLRARAELLEAA